MYSCSFGRSKYLPPPAIKFRLSLDLNFNCLKFSLKNTCKEDQHKSISYFISLHIDNLIEYLFIYLPTGAYAGGVPRGHGPPQTRRPKEALHIKYNYTSSIFIKVLAQALSTGLSGPPKLNSCVRHCLPTSYYLPTLFIYLRRIYLTTSYIYLTTSYLYIYLFNYVVYLFTSYKLKKFAEMKEICKK